MESHAAGWKDSKPVWYLHDERQWLTWLLLSLFAWLCRWKTHCPDLNKQTNKSVLWEKRKIAKCNHWVCLFLPHFVLGYKVHNSASLDTGPIILLGWGPFMFDCFGGSCSAEISRTLRGSYLHLFLNRSQRKGEEQWKAEADIDHATWIEKKIQISSFFKCRFTFVKVTQDNWCLLRR